MHSGHEIIKVVAMRRWSVLVLCMLLLASIFTIPITSVALDFNMDSKLSNANASFWGENANDNSGLRVAIAGDVNGDGYDDILISAHYNDENGVTAGQAYLFFGKASGWSMDADLSNADASFWGEHIYDTAGLGVAGAGDVNGDGYDDILIGAQGNDDGGSNAGQTYLIFGKASGWDRDTNLSKSNASFLGEGNSDFSGDMVAGAGDVNGDGYDDFLIGVYGSAGGQTYLILGKASGWAMDTDLSKVDASFEAENAGDGAGRSVDGAGDVNGDGYDDILIGAYGNNDGGYDAGQTYLIFGKASGWAMDTDLSKADASFWGEDAYDYSGTSVAGAGDVNGDGYDDILIGAYGDDDGGNVAGQTYLILGKPSGWTMDADLSNANASFWGEDMGDESGMYVAGAGDVNGDGYDDILIGASWNNAGGDNAGQTYLVLGKPSGWAMDADLSNANASFWGEHASDESGYSLAGAGDVNGDGYDDILIGAYANDDGGSDAGQSYLIFPDSNSKPSSIDSVKAYTDNTFSFETTTAPINDTVFIELKGIDGDSNTNDTTLVNVKSSTSDKHGFILRLRETGKNTGAYRGNLTIMNRTSEHKGWINTSNDETVTISSVQDPTKYASILIGTRMHLWPSKDNSTALEDAPYKAHYWTNSSSAQWKFKTNASWLAWNSTTHNISGLPTNADVVSYYVMINVTHAIWGSDEHNFTLTVDNLAPNITTKNVTVATEDVEYKVDYASTDDGSGTITWHLKTNADNWLSVDPSTGILEGTPSNEDVGQYYVNISVDDGNGGRDHSNFTLTVPNTNDAPSIMTQNDLTAIEDELYTNQYTALDVDVGDFLSWTMTTNASSWLIMEGLSGFLSGIPSNDDVGSYWINVTVKDLAKASDFTNFTLTVQNVNDQPLFTSAPVTEATALYQYIYDVTAEDIDVGDVLTFSLTTKPEGMTIESDSGKIRWTPTIPQKGLSPVVVKVSDGNASATQAFNVTVAVPTSYPPVVTLLSPANATDVSVTNPKLSWSAEDPDNDTIYFDVYLSSVQAQVQSKDLGVKVTDQTISTVFIPMSELQKGMTYYWTVIPSDGKNTGKCANGVWRFKVNEDAVLQQKPTVVLNQPVDGAIIKKEPIQLKWSGVDPNNEVIHYDVYLSTEKSKVSALDSTALVSHDHTDDFYNATGLVQRTTYYWTVIPNDGTNTGDCTSGIWAFKVDDTVAVNRPPVITSSPVKNATIGKEYRYDVDATDEDGDKLQFGLIERPAGMVIDALSGLIIWTPVTGQDGNHTITVKVSDGSLFVVQTFTVWVKKVGVINNKPVISLIPDKTIKVGDEFVYSVAATDADAGDFLTYLLGGPPAGMTISSTGIITWTPSKDQVGEHTITVNVSDGKDNSTARFKVTVKKNGTPPTHNALDATMLGIIAAVVIAVILVLVAAVAMRKRREEPEVTKVETKAEGPKVSPRAVPSTIKKEPEAEEPQKKKVETETTARVKEEIDLDDLEDED